MAKASAEDGATHYLGEGDPVPDDLPEGVRLVGPGAPEAGPAEDTGPAPQDAPEAEPDAEPEAVGTFSFTGDATLAAPASDGDGGQGDGAGEGDGPADYASYPVLVLRDLAKERGIALKASVVKADLVAALAQWDADHPDGDADDGTGAALDGG